MRPVPPWHSDAMPIPTQATAKIFQVRDQCPLNSIRQLVKDFFPNASDKSVCRRLNTSLAPPPPEEENGLFIFSSGLNRVRPSPSHICLTSAAASSWVIICVRSLSITSMVQSSVMSRSTLGEILSSQRTLAPALERQSWIASCSDADRIAAIVASLRGRAKLGLQASSRLSKPIRRPNLGRSVLVVVVEELVEVEVVIGAIIVTR